jgi:hypothetical protein
MGGQARKLHSHSARHISHTQGHQTDYLTCLIESAPPGETYESSYEGIVARLLQFGFASIHTSINVRTSPPLLIPPVYFFTVVDSDT